MMEKYATLIFLLHCNSSRMDPGFRTHLESVFIPADRIPRIEVGSAEGPVFLNNHGDVHGKVATDTSRLKHFPKIHHFTV